MEAPLLAQTRTPAPSSINAMGLWPHGAEPRETRAGAWLPCFPACILKASRGPALISDSPWWLQHNLGYGSEPRCGRRPGPLPPPAETRQSGLPEATAEATLRPADEDRSRLPKRHSVLTGPCEQRFLRLWPRHPCTRPRFTPHTLYGAPTNSSVSRGASIPFPGASRSQPSPSPQGTGPPCLLVPSSTSIS